MEILQINNAQFTNFIEDVQKIISNLSEKAKQEETRSRQPSNTDSISGW